MGRNLYANAHPVALKEMADRLHGQPLREVEIEEVQKQDPIQIGDTRINENGRKMTCFGTHKSKVYFNYENGTKFSMSSRKWRSLKAAE